LLGIAYVASVHRGGNGGNNIISSENVKKSSLTPPLYIAVHHVLFPSFGNQSESGSRERWWNGLAEIKKTASIAGILTQQ
jgi:hypothetical protein